MWGQIFLLVSSLIFIIPVFVESRNPGFATKITQKGLDFVSGYSKDELRLFLGSGKKYTFQGDVDTGFRLELDNVRVEKFSPNLRSKIYLRPNAGLEWRMTEITASIDANFRSRINTVRTTGKLRMKLYRMGAILKLSLEPKNRGLTTRLTGCHVYIGLVDLKSTKGALESRLLSIKRNLSAKAKKFFQNNFCEIIRKHLAEKVTRKLFNMPRAAHLFDNYYINYELADAPTFFKNSVETRHHGECFALARSRQGQAVSLNSTAYRYNPPRLDTLSSLTLNKKMNYYFMTDYHLQSMVYWMHRFGRFNYKFDKDQLGSEFSDYLKTECEEEDLCAGSLFPTLAHRFPKSFVEVVVNGLRSPEIKIVEGKINISTVGQIDGYARRPDGGLTQFITAKIRLLWTFKEMTMKNATLNGKLKFASYELYEVKTDVEEFDMPSLDFLTEVTLETTVKPDIANVLKDGIKMPKLLDFQPIDEEVRIVPGLLVASNNYCRGMACLISTKTTPGTVRKGFSNSAASDYDYDFLS